LRVCQIDGCDGKHVARGWCQTHYDRWRRHGDPEEGGPLQVQVDVYEDDERNPRHGRATLGWAEVARRWDVPYQSLRAHMDPDHTARAFAHLAQREAALQPILRQLLDPNTH